MYINVETVDSGTSVTVESSLSGSNVSVDQYGSDFKNIIVEDIRSDGKVININRNGGSFNYARLYNRPSIEGVTLEGNKTFEELNLQRIDATEIMALLS